MCVLWGMHKLCQALYTCLLVPGKFCYLCEIFRHDHDCAVTHDECPVFQCLNGSRISFNGRHMFGVFRFGYQTVSVGVFMPQLYNQTFFSQAVFSQHPPGKFDYNKPMQSRGQTRGGRRECMIVVFSPRCPSLQFSACLDPHWCYSADIQTQTDPHHAPSYRNEPQAQQGREAWLSELRASPCPGFPFWSQCLSQGQPGLPGRMPQFVGPWWLVRTRNDHKQGASRSHSSHT